jgi:hypothetical protein
MPAGLLQYARCYQLAVGISAAHPEQGGTGLERRREIFCQRSRI